MSDNFPWTEDLIKEFAEQYRFSSSRISLEIFKERHLIRVNNKPRQRLFVTEDGVDIFPGMSYWSVQKNWVEMNMGIASMGNIYTDDIKRFSTEAAAIQYAWDNKPIWSRKDFREIIRVLEEKITLKTPE